GLNTVTFTYAGTTTSVLKDINLTIPVNTLVGFAGKTGSGKTTLVDIILGLLIPQEGSILIDGTPVTSANIRNWQQNLGYVPQSIYLSNDTIASNIAFGHTGDTIDFKAVRDAAKMAQIDDFIMNELPEQYETKIGERGIRLSGGQRQRIGIARALYRNPSVLVMDEATSALDNQTEKDVMAAIDGLSGKKTIILIAHRLSTLKKCDQIFYLEQGVITRRGTYEELFADEH
ncbi:MAG TPA: ATP-binding cassette domain-containing protein, partial [Treponemataceae bacterium]|nr:ATP-binding cassette domain-containing protein [Treponemataceae bacterium]